MCISPEWVNYMAYDIKLNFFVYVCVDVLGSSRLSSVWLRVTIRPIWFIKPLNPFKYSVRVYWTLPHNRVLGSSPLVLHFSHSSVWSYCTDCSFVVLPESWGFMTSGSSGGLENSSTCRGSNASSKGRQRKREKEYQNKQDISESRV